MKSMTGYGKGEFKNEDFFLSIELKTVNNRYLDLSIREPKSFIKIENILRNEISKRLIRGKVDVYVSFMDLREGTKTIEIDWPLAEAYYSASKMIESKFEGIRNDFSVNSFFKIQDLIKPQSDEIDEETINPILIKVIEEALTQLNQMREKEGEKIKIDLIARIDKINSLVDKIKERAPLVSEEYRIKLTEKIQELLGSNYDESRIIQDVAMFTDKSNIDEEMTRLYSHIEQFRSICNKSGEVGKQLDFLIQEFNRESNTICSKANDINITNLALDLKCEIEKIREQIQNIE